MDSTEASDDVYEIGERVEARYKGGAKYFPGRILAKHDGNNYYDIDYDEKNTELKVIKEFIRRDENELDHDDDIIEGAKVNAHYRGAAGLLPGTITRVRANGTVDIDYENGKKEVGVHRELVTVISRPKRLIVTMGDPTDVGGYMALRIHCQTALKAGNTDIMFVLNYPAYYDRNRNSDLFFEAPSFPAADHYRAEDGLGNPTA